MKAQQKKPLQYLKGQARHSEKETQIEKHSEMMPTLFGDILTSDLLEAEKVVIGKSTQRALELCRKGIFACPRFSDFFADNDESKME